MITLSSFGKKQILEKTGNRCHVCATILDPQKYGKNKRVSGNWTVDHILPKNRGGGNSVENCLPACGHYNGLRWNRMDKKLREVLEYGIIALQEIRRKSKIGKELQKRYILRNKRNKRRRNKK